ncbi:MAG: hypothetical protein ACT4QF_18045 [Sporichthyaceae bacterium]
MDTSDRKAPIDPVDEQAARSAETPAGTPTDPAEAVQQFVDPDEAAKDPNRDPRAGVQR